MVDPFSAEFYSQHSELSDPGPYAAHFEDLPDALGPLCEALHGLLVHVFHAPKYGFQVPQERVPEIQLLGVQHILETLLRHDDQPLTAPRPPERRLIASCRHYSLLLVSVLRSRGIPARIRCGFETYIHRNRNGDHWVCEMYDAGLGRWRFVDAELDTLHREAFRISFDPVDLGPEQFIPAGAAWQRCRRGTLDPQRCGLLNVWGWSYVRANVVRDVLCLNKVELFPWDGTPLTALTELSPEQEALVEHLAELTYPAVQTEAVQAVYRTHPELHPLPLVPFGE